MLTQYRSVCPTFLEDNYRGYQIVLFPLKQQDWICYWAEFTNGDTTCQSPILRSAIEAIELIKGEIDRQLEIKITPFNRKKK